MTPELRNEIIRKAIDNIVEYDWSGVCESVYDAALSKGFDIKKAVSYDMVLHGCKIPFIFNTRAYYWPIEDRESRISFLKAQITC